MSESPVAATLTYVAKALVDHPDDVRVTATPAEGDGRILYRLDVHPDDAGRVIGRGGRVARAIRVVAKAAAAREGTHIAVQIGEPRPVERE